MNVSHSVSLALCGLLGAGLLAQSTDNRPTDGPQDSAGRSFAVVEHSDVRTAQGTWAGSGPLFRYVHEHPGTYVAFQGTDGVYRLDSPERLAEVRRLYAPMQALSAQQEALAHAQGPLAQQQHALGEQQRGYGSPGQRTYR